MNFPGFVKCIALAIPQSTGEGVLPHPHTSPRTPWSSPWAEFVSLSANHKANMKFLEGRDTRRCPIPLFISKSTAILKLFLNIVNPHVPGRSSRHVQNTHSGNEVRVHVCVCTCTIFKESSLPEC